MSEGCIFSGYLGSYRKYPRYAKHSALICTSDNRALAGLRKFTSPLPMSHQNMKPSCALKGGTSISLLGQWSEQEGTCAHDPGSWTAYAHPGCVASLTCGTVAPAASKEPSVNENEEEYPHQLPVWCGVPVQFANGRRGWEDNIPPSFLHMRSHVVEETSKDQHGASENCLSARLTWESICVHAAWGAAATMATYRSRSTAQCARTGGVGSSTSLIVPHECSLRLAMVLE
ncbi:hypothetical protein C8R45DRAFT_923040 [Mycena sanguinolenta]|nr:hypothetical protein C8R45DRAFT_923040 [Mycena sanguinolenta]